MELPSVEATMARLIGFDSETIPLLVEAEKYGLGTMNPKVLGESVESMAIKFKPLDWPRPIPVFVSSAGSATRS